MYLLELQAGHINMMLISNNLNHLFLLDYILYI